MWVVRARLTLLYGALFLIGGAFLLGVTLALVHQRLQELPPSKSAVTPLPGAGNGANLPASKGPPGANVAPSAISVPITATPAMADPPVNAKPFGTAAAPALSTADEAIVRKFQSDLHAATIEALITRGAIALGGFAIVGAAVGWAMAGRTLRPIEDAYDSQRRFVANASHELKTPLAISRGLLEMALRRRDPPAEVRELSESLLEVNHRQERLIDGLLILARSEQAGLRRVPLDLAQITETVIEETPADGLTVRSALSAAPMHGDPVLLERMVQNLLENAIKYNQPGGSVRVTCTRNRLTVTNTGPVVAREQLPALFEPFQRLHLGPDSPEGNGLGLSIVRSVAHAHRGNVTAVPNPDGGLTVTVDFRSS